MIVIVNVILFWVVSFASFRLSALQKGVELVRGQAFVAFRTKVLSEAQSAYDPIETFGV